MGLIVKVKKSNPIPPIEGGTYPAVCVGVVDLGEQLNEHYKKYEKKVILIFELPGQTVTVDGEDKPRWLSREFTQALGDKANLSAFLTSWRGKAFTDAELESFDLSEMLGKGCLLQVVKVEKGDKCYNNITTAIGLPVGFPAPEISKDTQPILFDTDSWSDEMFALLPEWIRNKVMKSTAYQKDHAPEETVSVGTATPSVSSADSSPAEQGSQSPAGDAGTPFSKGDKDGAEIVSRSFTVAQDDTKIGKKSGGAPF